MRLGLKANIHVGTGLLAGTMLMITIYGMARLRGMPKGEWLGWGEIAEAFGEAFWGLMLIVIIMVGIYGIPGITGAIFTPTEAAALGCIGALILALSTRKLNWEVITQSCVSTARTTAMIMALFVGGKFFSVVFLSMGGGDVVADVLLGMDVSPYVVFIIMMAVVFVMGMFIDWAAILLVVVPIFTPIAMDLDFNPLWFAMMVWPAPLMPVTRTATAASTRPTTSPATTVAREICSEIAKNSILVVFF